MNHPCESGWEAYRADCARLHPSDQVLENVYDRTIRKNRPRRGLLRPATILAAVALLFVVAAGAVTYQVHRSAWVHPADLSEAESVGFHYPASLGEYVPESMSRLHCAPTGSSDRQALLEPDYCWYSMIYRLDENRSMGIQFGSMDNPLWSEVTETDPDTEVWYPQEPGSENFTRENLQVVEYRGCSICLDDFCQTFPDPEPEGPEKIRDAEAQWLDRESGLWFSVQFYGTLSSSDGYRREVGGVSQEELLGYVRTIVDGQRGQT